MTTELIVAVMSSPVLVAAVGAWLGTRKTRRASESDHRVMVTRLDALAEDIGEVRVDLHEIRADLNRQGQQLARVETRLAEHLLQSRRV